VLGSLCVLTMRHCKQKTQMISFFHGRGGRLTTIQCLLKCMFCYLLLLERLVLLLPILASCGDPADKDGLRERVCTGELGSRSFRDNASLSTSMDSSRSVEGMKNCHYVVCCSFSNIVYHHLTVYFTKLTGSGSKCGFFLDGRYSMGNSIIGT